ncbi:MAG TPA: lipoyl(octanoyl) transferase LipB [Polyangia bacterium]|nr:lipoyl(octanoyl) transferase LipB [Polyangia bacterium]
MTVTSGSPEPVARWLGRISFDEALAIQERVRADVIAGTGPETLLLCEHEPVITLGRSARAENVLAPHEELARRGVAVRPASRGGDVTYHGPGQLVGYPIVRLRRGVVAHVEGMANGLAAVLATFGIAGRWRRDEPGLWIDRGEVNPPAKICAFGVHVRARVSMHGFALNVTTPLDAFRLIVPCGLDGAAVTSIAEEVGNAPSVAELAPIATSALATSLQCAFGSLE